MTTLQTLIDDFAFLEDWEERYRHLIDLGRALPSLQENEKTAENKVDGCISQVWLVADKGQDGRITLRADSDAHIVKGLVAIVLIAYSGKTPIEMGSVDIEQAFEALGLGNHLSPNRRNGFFAMIGRVKALASA